MASKKPVKSDGILFVCAISVAILFVGVFAYEFPASLRGYCAVHSSPEKPASYEFTIEGENYIKYGAAEKNAPRGTLPRPESSHEKAKGSAHPENESRNEPNTWWNKFWCDVNASDYFIALFTLILAIVTGFLWWTTHRLWKSGEGQIAAATKAAEAAERSSESYQHAERAWITHLAPDSFNGIGQKVIQGHVQNIQGTTFALKVKNVGRTPARECRVVCGKTLANPNGDPPTPPHYGNAGVAGFTNTGNIGPGQEIFVGQFVVTDAEIAEVKAGTVNLFLYICFDYTDVFKPEAKRVAESCQWVRYKGATNDGKDVWMYFPIGPQNQTT